MENTIRQIYLFFLWYFYVRSPGVNNPYKALFSRFLSTSTWEIFLLYYMQQAKYFQVLKSVLISEDSDSYSPQKKDKSRYNFGYVQTQIPPLKSIWAVREQDAQCSVWWGTCTARAIKVTCYILWNNLFPQSWDHDCSTLLHPLLLAFHCAKIKSSKE